MSHIEGAPAYKKYFSFVPLKLLQIKEYKISEKELIKT
jgi:hypothetical protein